MNATVRSWATRAALASAVVFSAAHPFQAAESSTVPYRNPALPVEDRIADLLNRMTLEEKVGQMNMPCVYESGLGGDIAEKMQGVQRFAAGSSIPGFGPGGGFFTLPNTILHEGTRQQAEFLNRLQRIALDQTRLGIPLLMTEEGTHGLMCPGATIFPEGPALGSTWNPELLTSVYDTVAKEARALGIHQVFTLVVEPIRDPRLGRNQEAYSEDPYLCSRITEAVVRGAQGENVAAFDKVVAGLCHYPGQSQPVSGLERGSMEISERALRETFLPPWQAGVQRCGALGVMATYPAIDGVPVHASKKMLTGILREELGFDGLVLSEGGGIGTLVYEGVAKDQSEAGALALAAGLDVGISWESGFMQDLIANVRQGTVPEDLVNRAVRRILKQKFRLGLFELPYVDVEKAVRLVHSEAHQDLALEAAREGIVLLRNENGLLPLKKNLKTIAVIGPNADNRLNQLGDYVPLRVPQAITTVLEGIRQVSPGTKINFIQGCNIVGNELNELEQAKSAAQAADATILVVGENEWRTANHHGTDGEGFDAATLELTGLQEELAKALHSTGKPMVVVLINGRPLATRWIAENAPAVLEAWLPGEKGGQAIAEVLFGDVNPSGRLSVSVPRHAGQLPVFYNARRSKAYWIKEGWGRPYVDMPPTPLYPFGFGLSYTTFAYKNLRVTPRELNPTNSISVQVDIRNTGSRAGAEVVQLYLRDVVSTVSLPDKQLRGFHKVFLQPGETRTCSFQLSPDDLALFDQQMRRVVEPGEFRVMIGASSGDIRLSEAFNVVADQR